MYVLRRPAILLVSAAMVAATVLPSQAGAPQQVLTELAATPETTAAPAEPEPVPELVPTQVSLPTLGVSAPVVPVGVESDGAMGTPSNARDVAWWEGVKVGAGNALLAGHKDWNKAPGSFFKLGQLKRGDPVVVSGPDGEMTFVVAWVDQMHKDTDAAALLGDQGQPTLTLITCGGRFDRAVRGYEDRIVARAVLAA